MTVQGTTLRRTRVEEHAAAARGVYRPPTVAPVEESPAPDGSRLKPFLWMVLVWSVSILLVALIIRNAS
ncbi:hypothetical protein DFP74_1330 [Nocardiopsis sp. Huas11]|uniref:hypothetical protein n=1 Tax=Nocardiopsis sp. Huas11 TaxID=2183912 RepID=UPI000EB15AAB|nr:hypothetical protein [Nocardiopsis sp. Huas11]RKS05722.1 hypothetical protein DFP74_1330 [Nocardiopsis sp. Huas11]